MGIALTDQTVKGLSCPEGRKDALYFDEKLRGFGVRVGANGVCTFLIQHKLSGRTRRQVIGTFGTELTTAQARRKAEALRGQVRDGKDIVADRKAADKAARATAAVERLTVDRLIDEWSRLHLSEKTEKHRKDSVARLRTAMADHLSKPAAEITKQDAIRALDQAKADRGASTADHMRRAGHGCWEWAIRRDDLTMNPWSVPPAAPQRQRERVLTDAELAAVWHAAGQLGHPFGGVVRLLALTGQRREEVAALLWAELDLDGAVWTLGGSRAKNKTAHLVPLSPAAVAILTALPRLKNAELVFENDKGTAPSGFSKAKARLDTLAGALPHWTFHDLRRTMATRLRALGVTLEVTEALLNHRSGTRSGIVAVYQHYKWEDEKREALNKWADYVLALPRLGSPAETGPSMKDILDFMQAPTLGGKARATQSILRGEITFEQKDAAAMANHRRKKAMKEKGFDPEKDKTPLDLAMRIVQEGQSPLPIDNDGQEMYDEVKAAYKQGPEAVMGLITRLRQQPRPGLLDTASERQLELVEKLADREERLKEATGEEATRLQTEIDFLNELLYPSLDP